jgi:hypothetical protein
MVVTNSSFEPENQISSKSSYGAPLPFYSVRWRPTAGLSCPVTNVRVKRERGRGRESQPRYRERGGRREEKAYTSLNAWISSETNPQGVLAMGST